MNSPHKIVAAVWILSTASGVQASSGTDLPGIEAGGGIRYLMPRQDYLNDWGLGLTGTWNFSRRYGLNLKYDVFQLTRSGSEDTETFSSLLGNVEVSFRRGSFAQGFTSLGLGAVSTEEDLMFVFGIGLRIPLSRDLLIRIELKDFFTQLGIPYLSFPGGFAALQGQGRSRYLLFGLGLNVSLGKTSRSQKSRSRVPGK